MKGCQGVHEESEKDGSLNPLKSHIFSASIFEEVDYTENQGGPERRAQAYVPES